MSENKDLIKSKAEISSYLRAATEIEKDIYVMEEACKEINACIESESESENEIVRNISGCKNKIKEHEERISNPRKYIPKETLAPTEKSEVKAKAQFGTIACGIFPFIAIFTYLVLGITVFDEFESVETNLLISVLVGLFVSVVIYFFGKIIIVPKKIKENERYNNHIVIDMFVEREKEELEKEKKAFDEYVKKADELAAHAEYHREQLNKLHEKLKILNANRDRFYSVGIVPPDYRTIDCVYVLDQIFRNDLADTMRDAVLLYEERTFRGDLIRGINNIVTHMDKLSSLLSGLRNDIKTIKLDVTEMCDNMEKIYAQNRDYAAASAQDRERLYEETKLHRFALEAIEESNKKLVDYIEK